MRIRDWSSDVCSSDLAEGADNTKSSPAVPKIAQKPAANGNSLIQLGAYGSKAVAEQAWTALSKRFDYLAGLEKSISAADVNGTTYYRLRAQVASNAQANELCGKLKVAGENCMAMRSEEHTSELQSLMRITYA